MFFGRLFLFRGLSFSFKLFVVFEVLVFKGLIGPKDVLKLFDVVLLGKFGFVGVFGFGRDVGMFTFRPFAVFSRRFGHFGGSDFLGNVFAEILDDFAVGGVDGADFEVVDFKVFELDFGKIGIPVFVPVLDFRPESWRLIISEKFLANFMYSLLLKEINEHGCRINNPLNDPNDIIFSKRVLGEEFNLTDQPIECLRTG